jgi:hypothetical protein
MTRLSMETGWGLPTAEPISNIRIISSDRSMDDRSIIGPERLSDRAKEKSRLQPFVPHLGLPELQGCPLI